MIGDPELTRMTFEVLGLSLISVIVGGVAARRRTLAWGVGAGFLAAVVLWQIVLYTELAVFARWS